MPNSSANSSARSGSRSLPASRCRRASAGARNSAAKARDCACRSVDKELSRLGPGVERPRKSPRARAIRNRVPDWPLGTVMQAGELGSLPAGILDLVPDVPPVRDQPFGDAEERDDDLVAVDPVPTVQHGGDGRTAGFDREGGHRGLGQNVGRRPRIDPAESKSGRSFQTPYRLRRLQGISTVLPGAGGTLPCLQYDVTLAMPDVPRKTPIPRTDVPGSYRIAAPSLHEISTVREFPRAHGGAGSAPARSPREAHNILVVGTTDVAAGVGHRSQIDRCRRAVVESCAPSGCRVGTSVSSPRSRGIILRHAQSRALMDTR